MLQGLLGNKEGRFHRPSQRLFGQADLFHTQRLPVGRRGVLLVGAAIANVGANLNQGWPARLFPGSLQRGGDGVDVVALFDLLDVPAECGETGHAVFGKGQLRITFDRDVVIGIEDDEFSQPQVTRIGPGLGRNSFLQVAIADQNVGVVVDDRVPRPIEACRHGHFGDSHADGVGQSLPQGTGGGFDAGGLAVFRMAGRTTSPLAESLQLFQRQVETRDMKQRIQERTTMSGRENEAVAVGPKGITRIELERAIPECISHGRRAQGQPGMARVGLLHHVHGQETERVDTQLIQRRRSERRRKCHRRCHGCAYLLLS